MTAVTLVIIFAVLQSFWWIAMKLLMRFKHSQDASVVFPNNLVRIASGLGAGLLIAWSLTLNGGVSYLASLSPDFWFWLAVAVIFDIGVAYCFIKAMQKSVASIAVHVTMLGPVVAIGTAYWLGVDQLPSILSIAGIVIIMLGLYILHFSPKKYGRDLSGPLRDIWQQRGDWLWYAVAVALFSGFALPLHKRLVVLSDYALAPGMIQFIGWGLFYGALAWWSGDFKKVTGFPRRSTLLGLGFIAIVFAVANAFAAAAYNFHYAAAVGALKRLDAPFTVLWAFWLPQLRQDEKESGGSFAFRILGSLIAFAGALLIGFDRS